MGDSFLPQLLRLVLKVLGTGQIPNNFLGDMLVRFRVTDKEVRSLLSELRSGQGIHAYLGLLADRMDSAPGMERFSLLIFDQ